MRVVKKNVNCSICNTFNIVDDICSVSSFGSGDLDFRPPFMSKYLISFQINVCIECNYVNSDLEEKIINAENIIKNESYLNQLENPSFPDKANAYLAHSIMLKSSNQIADAGWACLKAAWICDDQKKNEESIFCRKLALDMFMQAINEECVIFGMESSKDFDDFNNKILTIDIMRRISNFKESKKNCIDALNLNFYINNQNLKKIFQYELFLNENEDSGCHTIDEAIEYKMKE